MDFIVIPTATSSISLSPVVLLDSNVPIIVDSNYVNYYTNYPYYTVPNTTGSIYYYDTGAGSSGLAKHETNEYLRYKFLDNALVKEYKDILNMLKVVDGVVKPSKDGADGSDQKNVEKKVDFIGNEILTRSKNLKILEKIIQKNYHIRFFDLVHNQDLVFSTQAKYIKKKIREMR